MQQFHDLIQDILDNGELTKNRTGIDTLSKFGAQITFDLSKGFPAITTKKLAWKSVVAELLWFLEGSTDERRLAELTYGKHREALIDKQTIWTANANAQGVALGYINSNMEKQLGPVYGSQWRDFNGSGKDQVMDIIKTIRKDPDNRRLILTAWNPEKNHTMALPPCHCFAQFRVMNGKLHSQVYIRSNDIFLGAPFNIASYALLTHIIADVTRLDVGNMVYTIGDAHIYVNHIDQCKEMISREEYPLPKLVIKKDRKNFLLNGIETRFFWTDEVSNFILEGYQSHGAIRADMAV